MHSQVLPGSWRRLWGEAEVILTKQPNTAALAVILRIRNPQRRWLKLLPAAVTTGFKHVGAWSVLIESGNSVDLSHRFGTHPLNNFQEGGLNRFIFPGVTATHNRLLLGI